MAVNEPLWLNSALVQDPEFGASGFDLIPGGKKDGTFRELGVSTQIWSSTQTDITVTVWFRTISSYFTQVSRNSTTKEFACSIRCLQN